MLFVSIVTMLVLFSSCKKEDKAIIPIFPEKQTVSVKANESKELTFDANVSWKLTSSQTWCKFIVNNSEELSLSGTEGKQKITLKITDENIEFQETSATLTLQMGTQSEVIAEVKRAANNYTLKVLDAEGKEVQSIEIGYKTHKEYTIEANFDFAATKKPNWVEVEGGAITGKANSKTKAKLIIIADGSREKYPVVAGNENTITFANEAGTANIVVPVSYAGMNAEEIEISGNTSWNWTVSMDGKSFTQTTAGNDPVKLTNNIPFTIKALKDEVEYLYMEVGNNQLWATDENGEAVKWMHVVNGASAGEVKLTVDKFTPTQWGSKKRSGAVFALPKAKHQQALTDIVDGADYDKVMAKYESNLLIEIVQKDASSGISVKKSGYLDITTKAETNNNILDYLKNELFIEDVFAITSAADEYYTICPELELFGEEEGELIGKYYAVTASGEDIENKALELQLGGKNEENLYYVELSTPKSFTQPIIIVFVNGNWQEKKALVIHPSTSNSKTKATYKAKTKAKK